MTLKLRGALLAVIAMLALHMLLKPGTSSTRDKRDVARTFNGPGGPRIAKVSMLYGKNPLYERALRSHHVHNERHNYPMQVLREDVTGGYWNKPSYLLSLIVQELAKSPEKRAEWLM